jgi:hypothetical protein
MEVPFEGGREVGAAVPGAGMTLVCSEHSAVPPPHLRGRTPPWRQASSLIQCVHFISADFSPRLGLQTAVQYH